MYNGSMKNNIATTYEDWDLLAQFFPDGWDEQAKLLGAVTRQRKFKSASDLLRMLMIHLADGCSMRETSARAKQGGLADVSDVALLKRLRNSGEWLRWMAVELLKRRGVTIDPPEWLSNYTVRSVDASVITEPGSTGTDWRLHYSIKLFGLQCDQFIISDQSLGESFVNFNVTKGDLLLGDRAYGRLNGLKHVVSNGGFFLARLKNKAFKISNSRGVELDLLGELKNLAIGEVRDLEVIGGVQPSELRMRLCAVRKSDEEAGKSMMKAIREQKKKQRKIDPETIELHRYIVLVTSLPMSITAFQIAELYRTRWQIEIAFKRLKSIMDLGHLPKKDETSSRAWLHGKIFIALLVQAIIDEGHFFSPWGYPIRA